ncbi:MAG TPA: PA domain-containing protein, partial [Thermoanaerobaculia bacterium]|nr:PA domain-containing protein [Thermoanaerobaculia bacterium]
MTLRSIAILAVLLTLASAATLPAGEPVAVSLPALRAHLEFLADDLLEGRDTGSRGHELAALYAATRFAELGLEPGAGDSYLQRIEFATIQRQESSIAAESREGKVELAWKDDYLFDPKSEHPELELAAPVVFAGYGVDAPDLGHRDYEGLDVRGKIALVLSGAPASFPSTQRAHHSSRRVKGELAARHGAVAVVVV